MAVFLGVKAAARMGSLERELESEGCQSAAWLLGGVRPGSSATSLLLPASRTVRCGEARARASERKVGRALKEACEVMS